MAKKQNNMANAEETAIKWGKYLGIPFVVILFLALMFRLLCVTFIDNYEFGYKYDYATGEMKSVNRQGYIIAAPWVSIHTIDLRPTQVCINANSRVLNCKLVQFDTTGWRTFVAWHGRDNYENSTYHSEGGGSSSGLNGILLSYAYDGSGKAYPFLKVIRELKPDDQPKVTQSITPTDTTK